MQKPLHVLIVEDSEDDAILFVRELKKGGFDPIYEQVDSPEKLESALEKGGWDLVLSDYSLPHFNGFEALRLVKSKNQNLPFLIVSGSIGEETAVRAMKAGAQDYLMKNNLPRLVPAVERELKEAHLRQEQRQAEEALAKARELFRGIYESCNDGIVFADFEGQLLDVNPAFVTLTGYSKEELLSMKYQELTPEIYHSMEKEKVANVIRTGQSTEYEKEYIKKDGSQIPILLTVFVVKGTTSQSTGVAAFVKDISERKRLEVMKDALISTVSHEMRTPLTVMKGSLDNLRMGIGGALKKAHMKVVDTLFKNVNRLERIVTNTFHLSRLQSGWTVLHRRPLVLQALVEEVFDSLKEEADERKIKLVANLETLPPVNADSDLMTQLFSNLIDNAIRFATSHVFIKAEPSERKVRVSVIDDGPGISEENQKRLFNKFEQINRPEGGEGYQGTGLGLIICKKIIEEYGGKIWMESSPERGTQFHFTLPD